MSRLDTPRLVVRGVTKAHSSYLVGLAPKRADEYSRVADLVFQHQPAVYDQPSKTPNSQEHVPNVKTIADHFYRTPGCFIWPELLAGIAGAKRTKDEFERGVVFEHDFDERNHLSFLLGEVGLLGTLIYTCVVGVYLWTLLREHSLFSSGVRWGTAAIFLAAFTEAAIAGMTINVENDRALWTLLGLLECYRRLYIERGWRPLSTGHWMSPSPRGAEAHSFPV